MCEWVFTLTVEYKDTANVVDYLKNLFAFLNQQTSHRIQRRCNSFQRLLLINSIRLNDLTSEKDVKGKVYNSFRQAENQDLLESFDLNL